MDVLDMLGILEYGPYRSIRTIQEAPSMSQAAVFGLAIHAWMLISVTGAGGIIFLTHRIRIHNHRPLFVEIEELPTELP